MSPLPMRAWMRRPCTIGSPGEPQTGHGAARQLLSTRVVARLLLLSPRGGLAASEAMAPSGPHRAALLVDAPPDQYSIEIKSLRTGETVILTAVDMTEQEKSVVVRQLLRLSGAPAALWIEDDEPKKPF